MKEGTLTHGWGCHANAGHYHLENGLLSCSRGLTQAVPILIRDGDPQLELSAGRVGVRGAPGHAGGGIKGQGRDTAQGHVSKGGWCPSVFPIHCLCGELRAGPTFTLDGSSAELDRGGINR